MSARKLGFKQEKGTNGTFYIIEEGSKVLENIRVILEE